MKSSFILHFEQALIFDAMTDAQAGQLIKRIFQHAMSGESDDCDDPAVKFSMISIRARMDADNAHYLQTCKKRSESGKMGGRGNTKANAFSESKCFLEKANESKRKQKKPSDIDFDFDLDLQEKDNTPPTPHRGEERAEQPKRERKSKPAPPLALADDFAAFWAAYPRRTAKADAVKAWNKLAKSGDLPELPVLLTAISQQAEANDWARENGRYCPHPATWLNGKRWEDAVGVTPTAHVAADMSRYREWAAGYATKRAALVPDGMPATAAEIEAGAQVLAEYIDPEGFSEDEMARMISWILAKPERARHVKSLAELTDTSPGWGFVMTWANNGAKGLDVGDDPRAWRQVANG